MPMILVCPLSALPDMLVRYRPSHVVSLLSPDYLHLAVSDLPAERHLKLGFHDIPEPEDGKTAPDEIHVAALLGFAQSWDGTAPMIVHCWAGVSRSMASAYSILCARGCRDHDGRLAEEFRARAPHAQPNRRIVRLADRLLNRGGRMIAAVDAMGPGIFVEEGPPVEFPLALVGQ